MASGIKARIVFGTRVVLSPKQLHTLLGHVAQAKVQFEKASRGFKSQLAAELDAAHQDGKTDCWPESVGDQ
jgi:hypothetical protein